MRGVHPFLAALAVFALLSVGSCDDVTHIFEEGEEITVWFNKIGPYHNPQETYNYFSAPYCTIKADKSLPRKFAGLGEVLEGNELVDQGLKLKFLQDVNTATMCAQSLDAEQAELFEYAIRQQYWGQLYIDDLPMWHYLGSIRDDTPVLFTHYKFTVLYNDNRIIEVNLETGNAHSCGMGDSLTFTYSVKWQQTDVPFNKRFHRYLDFSFFEHQIHWFSIFHSFMLVIFLTGLVSLILMRTLKNDYQRYSEHEEELGDFSDEYGWKLVSREVFRSPPNLMFFSVLMGTGWQLLATVAAVIVVATIGTLYTGRGAVVTAFVLVYTIMSFVGGYASGGMYKSSGGQAWIKCMIASASFFPLVCVTIGFTLNTIAIAYVSLAAVPFTAMVNVTLLFLFVSVPLNVMGTIVGRHCSGLPPANTRASSIPRPIPEKKWYMKNSVIILAGGILPFGSIFIELYFIFTSFWNYKFYYVYGFMMLVFVILLIVSVCSTIVSTYFLLNAEDYRWQWNSFLSSASTSIYVFGYAIYYFHFKTHMAGFMQTCFYFGYMSIFCFGLAIMTGTIGYVGASFFVQRIYSQIKND